MAPTVITEPCLVSTRPEYSPFRKRANVVTEVAKEPPVRAIAARSASSVSLSSANMRLLRPSSQTAPVRAFKSSRTLGASIILTIIVFLVRKRPLSRGDVYSIIP